MKRKVTMYLVQKKYIYRERTSREVQRETLAGGDCFETISRLQEMYCTLQMLWNSGYNIGKNFITYSLLW